MKYCHISIRISCTLDECIVTYIEDILFCKNKLAKFILYLLPRRVLQSCSCPGSHSVGDGLGGRSARREHGSASPAAAEAGR